MKKQAILAVVLALLAGLLTYYYLSEKEAAIQANVTRTKVLLAKQPINRGDRLSEENIVIGEMPRAFLMPGAIASDSREKLIAEWERFKGQFTIVPVAEGEQLLPNKLSKVVPGFSSLVPEGKRIITLALPLAAGVGGHIRPGNIVDIIGSFDHQFRGAKRLTSVVLAQNILISAVGENTAQDTKKTAKNEIGFSGQSDKILVSLVVTPEQAVKLTLAEEQGRIKLALRSIGDDQMLDLADQNLSTVLSPLLRVRQEDIQPAKKSLEIIRGLE